MKERNLYDRWLFQQTDKGKQVVELTSRMKKQYCDKLGIPVNKIKTGEVKALVNGNTGEIDRFIEK